MKFCKFIVLLLAIVIYTTSNPVSVGWSPSIPATDGPPVHHYELVLVRDVSLTEYWYGTPDTTTSITIPKPKSGKYELKVRGVAYNSEGLPLNSDWCSSLDSNCALLKEGTPGAWKVYWKPSGIQGPVIITPKSELWNSRILVDLNFLANGGRL